MSWEKLKLGEICTIEKGAIGIQKAIPGKYPLVVTAEERKSHNIFQFDDEAVIIPLVSGTGHGHASIKRIHFQKGKFALGSILCALIPKNKNQLSAEYLYRFLDLNKETELVSRMKGMANVTLPIAEIFKIEIPVPPLQQQIEFVNKYKDLEIRSDLLSKEFCNQLNILKKLRLQLLQDALQGKLIPQNIKDESVFKLLNKIEEEKSEVFSEKKIKKQKKLPPISTKEIPFEIPATWVWQRLGEICNYGNSPKAEPKHLTKNTWVLDLEDIEKETSKLLFKIKFSERNSLSTKNVFKKNDVLYSKLRPYLDKVIVADEDGVCTTEILPLKTYGGINPHFLKYSLKRNDFLSYVNSVTKGMKMPRLGTKEGQLALIPLPPLQEQDRIVSKLKELMLYCDELEKSIKQSAALNENLLRQFLIEALVGDSYRQDEKSAIATEQKSKQKTEIIKSTVLQEPEEKHFIKRKVLATYIINQSLSDSKFGDVKFEKLLHLSDYFAIKRNLGQKYFQQAAGPYDNAFTNAYFHQIKSSKWFNRTKNGRQFVFSPAQNHYKSKETYNYFSQEELNRVNAIITYFKKYDYEQPEIISTLYAVWNNRIISKQEIKDDFLIADFYAWDKQKKKYEIARLKKALEWMKDKQFVPDGWGRLIEKASNKKTN